MCMAAGTTDCSAAVFPLMSGLVHACVWTGAEVGGEVRIPSLHCSTNPLKLTSGDRVADSRVEPACSEFGKGVVPGSVDVAGGHAGASRDCKNIGRILLAGGEVDGVGQMGEVGGTREGWATLFWLGANTEEVSMATTVQLKR